MDDVLSDPLAPVSIPSRIAALPKADIHIHAEWLARLDRVMARREGRLSYDWQDWVAAVIQEPPGMPRLNRLSVTRLVTDEMDAIPENFVARVDDLLEEAAADGAILLEVRFGKDIERSDFLTLFREAVQRVQAKYPRFRAQAIGVLLLWLEPERLARLAKICIEMAANGLLYGVDFLYRPYSTEAEWGTAYQIAAQMAEASLGITVHVGEMSSANLTAALQMPGLTRLGHATYAGYDAYLLDTIAEKNLTIECSLSCNVVLGSAPSYHEHPIRRFVEHGIRVALCTDNPVQVCTTIGREYAIAHALGFSESELIGFTRNAIQAAFINPVVRNELLAELDDWKA